LRAARSSAMALGSASRPGGAFNVAEKQGHCPGRQHEVPLAHRWLSPPQRSDQHRKVHLPTGAPARVPA
jgi:hypothetical protein